MEEIQAIAARAAETVLENQAPEEPAPEVEPTQEEKDMHSTYMEGFQCKIKTEPLKDWFATEFGPDGDGECRPCRMLPLASLYLGVLQKAGKTEDAKGLEKVYEGGDILTIAEYMDKIKMRAEEGLRQSLEGLDCFAQSFEMEAEEAPKEE